MERHVIVSFGPDSEYEFHCSDNRSPVRTVENARDWLEQQFHVLECEVVTPTGKILIIDKILAVARNAGEKRFASDSEWALHFACSTALALNRAAVRVNVVDDMVSY
jgi:hypothetical protein